MATLLAENIIIVENGKAENIPSSVLIQNRPNLISVHDWKEMERRGEAGLASGGWRGCFFAHGKAVFNVDDGGELRLSSFDTNMAWD